MIAASSQQSRFHTATLNPSSQQEVDLVGVNISVGDKEILTDSKIRLREGVKYALVGRNGTGKSTLLEAIAGRLIPGLSPSLQIGYVSQIQDGERANGYKASESVLQHVLRGHTARENALAEQRTLLEALECTDNAIGSRLVNEILVGRAEKDLVEARRIAKQRSGVRGKKARDEETAKEAALRGLSGREVITDWLERATVMLSEVQLELDILDVDSLEGSAIKVLRGLGFSRKMIAEPYDALSGGWRARCALALALIIECDLLLLDEPSNFMDLEAIVFLERYLSTSIPEQSLVITSHDQTFLNNIVEETIVVRRSQLVYFKGTPQAMMEQERKERINKQRMQDALDRKKENMEISIAQGRKTGNKTGDENRLRMVKSRQKKLDNRWGLEQSAKGTRFKLNRDLAGFHLTARGEIEVEEEERGVRIRLNDPPMLEKKGNLLHLEEVGHRYTGGSKWVVRQISLTIALGDRIALVGANGEGKSTIVKMIAGEIDPAEGKIDRHPRLRIGYFSQHSVEALSEHTKTSALSHFMSHFEERGTVVSEPDARACLGSFGLGGVLADRTSIGSLSGGQRVRLALSLILYEPPQLLVLDEVTTHVDAPTVRGLGRALKGFRGAIILVTHDRYVVERNSDEIDGSSSDSSSSYTEEEKYHGRTYHIHKASTTILPAGMSDYERFVDKQVEKRMKERS